MKYIWRLIKYGIGLEWIRWQWEKANIAWYIGQTSNSFEDKIEKWLDTAAMWDIASSNWTFVTKQWSEWDLWFDLWAKSIWYFLKALLWWVSSVSSWDWSYIHTFTRTINNQHPSMVITAEEWNAKYLYKLAMLESFKIDVQLWALVACTATFKTKKWETFTESVNSSYFSEEKFNSAGVSFRIADTKAWLATADEICIKSCSLTFTKNLKEDICLWSIDLDDLLNQNFDISWTLEFDYDDNTFKHLALSQTYKALSLWFVWSEEISTWKYNTVSMALDRVSFSDYDRNKSNDEIVTQSVSFNAHSYWDFCKILVQNQQATY